MASGTADLQRDLGGAIMQSILGALLTAGYASAMSAAIAASEPATITDSTQAQLTKSFAGAEDVAEQHPQYADQIIAAAKAVVPRRRPVGLHGRDRRDRARCGARLLPLPEEGRGGGLLAAYHAEDSQQREAHDLG